MGRLIGIRLDRVPEVQEFIRCGTSRQTSSMCNALPGRKSTHPFQGFSTTDGTNLSVLGTADLGRLVPDALQHFYFKEALQELVIGNRVRGAGPSCRFADRRTAVRSKGGTRRPVTVWRGKTVGKLRQSATLQGKTSYLLAFKNRHNGMKSVCAVQTAIESRNPENPALEVATSVGLNHVRSHNDFDSTLLFTASGVPLRADAAMTIGLPTHHRRILES